MKKNKENIKQQRNKKYKTTIKNLVKTINKNIKENNKKDVFDVSKLIQKYSDKAYCKGIIHKNKSNRIKSKVQKSINKFNYIEQTKKL